MNHLPFNWEGPVPLATELRKPLERLFLQIEHPAWGGPTSVTFVRSDGSFLTVPSEMHDVAPRIEIGVLSFIQGQAPPNGAKVIDFGPAFRGDINVSKLVIEESGTTAESGVILQGGSEELTVVAGAFPYTLAVGGVVTSLRFEPEYPLDRYVRAHLP